MPEIWKKVPNFKNYEISNFGRIRNNKLHIRKYYLSNSGYYQIDLYNNNRRTKHYIHRLVLYVFIGKCPRGHNVNHKDGNKLNNCLSNLEYVTLTENMLHASRMGLLSPPPVTGSKNGNAKLSEYQVRLILHDNRTLKEIAKDYEVSPSSIARIKRREGWKHVA